MRGARPYGDTTVFWLRIIPADAGSTVLGFWDVKIWQDHPRGCGEHVDIIKTEKACTGSSPRMRGARVKDTKDHEWSGIIPADAGSTNFPKIMSNLG